MALKKSQLYSALWSSCDELRGGMDASQYKDYVLFMLFIKYISDKYADSDDFAPPVTIPKGSSFEDMVALKGDSDIGNKINTQVIQPLIDANSRLARTEAVCRDHCLAGERRPPRPGVDARELKPVALPIHAGDHVADAAPAVGPTVEETQLGVARRDHREANGGVK